MRPYLAILKDSVREAVRSRTLPFLLVFFTVVLAILAPMGLRDETAWRLEPGDLVDAPLLTAKLRRDAAKPNAQPGDRVLALLPADLRDAVLAPAEQREATAPDEDALRDALNSRVLTDAAFYDESAFEGVTFPKVRGGFGEGEEPAEAERLLGEGPGSLSPNEVGRLNRLLLTAAFPQAFVPPQAERVQMTYAGYDVADEVLEPFEQGVGLELNRSGVRFIARAVMNLVASWIAGPVGVLIALVVTAALIPQTFEGGAIDLLLSKPVGRAAMFITKFIGGCVFVGLAGLYLCVGLWLIAGLRLGAWDAGVIASAGVLTVQFAVFYSVSASVGVLWRNPIVCVMASVGVWALSFLLNVVYLPAVGFAEARRPANVLAGAGEVFVANGGGEVSRWAADRQEWVPALYPAGAAPRRGPLQLTYRLSGPHFVPQTDGLAAVEVYGGGGGAVRRPSSDRRLYTADAAGGWSGQVGPASPPLTSDLLIRPDGTPLLAGRLGVFAPPSDEPADGDAAGAGGGFFDSLVGQLTSFTRDDFERIVAPPDDGSAAPSFPEPFAAGVDTATGDLAVYAGGVLRLYGGGGGEASAEVTLFDENGPAGSPTGPPAVLVAAGGGGALVVTGDGAGKAVAADGSVREVSLVPGDRPRKLAAGPDGRLALATHGGAVWVGAVDGAGTVVADDATAAGWGEDGSLWVGTGPGEVTRFAAAGDGFEIAESFAPPPGFVARFVRFVLTPLHYLLPDTVGLSATLDMLFQGDDEESAEALGGDLDLRQPLQESDGWGPLIHNLAFTGFVLLLTCWHVARTDF